MNRNSKRKIDANYVLREGKYAIRPAVTADAARYIDRFHLPLCKELRDAIVDERREIKEFQKSLTDFCFAVVEQIDKVDVVIGLIETKSKRGTYGCEAYVEFFFPSKEDKAKRGEIEEVFLHLLKEVQLYDKVYIYTTDLSHPLLVKEVQIA